MSVIACGSIHQGHERFILVTTLEEDKRFLCLAALLCRFANGARCQDIDMIKSFFMEIIFFSVHSAAVFFSFRQKCFHSE